MYGLLYIYAPPNASLQTLNFCDGKMEDAQDVDYTFNLENFLNIVTNFTKCL